MGVFKSFKSNFSKACSKYVAVHPGRVITSDKLASLVAEAWPLSLSPLNIMAGFKKTGIYPINPSEVTDRQIAPSKPFQQLQTERSQDDSASDNPTNDPLFSPDKVELNKKRYKEGYDLDDPSYTAWLKINHPTEVCSKTMKSSSSLVSAKVSKDSADSGKLKLSNGDALSEILALPCPVPKTESKRKAALNAKAICITDDTVLEDLKRKEVEKAEAKKEKEVKRIERERKKKIREEKRLERECKKAVREEEQLKKKCTVSSGRKTRSRKSSTQEKGIDDTMATLHLLSSSSDEDGDTHSSQGDSSVVLSMAIVLRSGSAVMAVASGTTKSVQTLRKEFPRSFIVKLVLYKYYLMDVPA